MNEDNRPDLIVKTRTDRKFAFIQQEDGSYKLVDTVQKEKEKALKEALEEQKVSIEEKIHEE